MKIKNDKKNSCTHARDRRKRMFLPLHDRRKSGGRLVSFGKWARRDKVWTYNWTRAAKMWEDSLRPPSLGGGLSKGGGLRCDLVEKHVKTKKKIQGVCLLIFFSAGYFASLCLADAVVLISIFSFFSPVDFLLVAVVNKPLGSWKDFLAFVHFYHGGATTGTKFSLVP